MRGDVLLRVDGRWLKLADPVQIITAFCPDEVVGALAAVETAVNQQGLFAAGFIAYEAAAAFDLPVHPPQKELPLLWFGLYQLTINNWQLTIDNSPMLSWQPSASWEQYEAAINRIKTHIAVGNAYQVNYTFSLRASFTGEPSALFAHLAANQTADYMAYVDTGRHVICSASPELFFRLDGEVLTSQPMKGTAGRGRTLVEDEANIAWLAQSEKNRAENVMIVDMIRNDMGRVAAVGSVAAPELFAVERYPTVLQMTSTVTARTSASVTDILAAMFPCASITGAPKRRTMQIIRELEPEPRGVYTGAIGWLAPQRQAQFNVAIRTVVVDKAAGTAVYGVGGGIVWDSEADSEYEECRVKAKVLQPARPAFDLLESLLWTPDEGYFLLAAHLERLSDSAAYFGFEMARTAVRDQLLAFAGGLSEPVKVRLTLAKNGGVRVTAAPLSQGAVSQPVRVGLARQPVDSQNVFLFHKSTFREMYDVARDGRADCDEAILWNERGEITEATTANVALELDGRLWTPPVDSGLLAGTFRGHLLADGQIAERVITLDEFRRATRLWLINSVRGWRRGIGGSVAG